MRGVGLKTGLVVGVLRWDSMYAYNIFNATGASQRKTYVQLLRPVHVQLSLSYELWLLGGEDVLNMCVLHQCVRCS